MSDITPSKKPALSTYEAFVFKNDVINKWHPQSEVWAFKHGDGILGCMNILGGIVITHLFRRKLKLLPYARLTCYVPVVGISSIFCCMIQDYFISSQIVKSNKCPLCVATKSVITQVVLGVAYPLVTSSVVCFYMADRLLTYPVPPLTKAPMEVFQIVKKFVLKNPRPYLIIGGIHVIAASFITFQKQQTMANLELKVKYR